MAWESHLVRLGQWGPITMVLWAWLTWELPVKVLCRLQSPWHMLGKFCLTWQWDWGCEFSLPLIAPKGVRCDSGYLCSSGNASMAICGLVSVTKQQGSRVWWWQQGVEVLSTPDLLKRKAHSSGHSPVWVSYAPQSSNEKLNRNHVSKYL